MLTRTSKNTNRRHVHERIRKKVLGTSERPRLNVYRSLNHIYVQVIDDLQGATVVFAQLCRRQKRRAAHGRQRGLSQGGRQSSSPSAPKPRASAKSYLTAAATSITAG